MPMLYATYMILVDWTKKQFKRLYNAIVGENATPEFVARGWAIGMFYGCMIPMGGQLLLSIPTAFLLRGSRVGATLGTLITNHFTIFVIYPAQCYVGAVLTGRNLSWEMIKEAMDCLLMNQDYDTLFSLGADLLISFFAGSALLAAVMTPITYFLVKFIKQRKSPPAE